MGGGVFAGGDTILTNTTFSNNRASQGGGLFAIFDVTILNSTFNDNRADQGGAIWREAASNTSVRNTILAGSLDSNGGNPSLNCDGPTLTSLGRNIVSDNSCVPNPPVNGDLLGTDPQLGLWFGSPIRGYFPAPLSPAVGYGLDCPAVDQRGLPRPLNSCEVGSIELDNRVFLPLMEG